MPVVRFGGNSLLQVSSLTMGPYTIAAVFKTTGNSQIVYEHSDDTLTNTNGNFLYTSTQSTISVKRAGAQTGKDILGAGAEHLGRQLQHAHPDRGRVRRHGRQ